MRLIYFVLFCFLFWIGVAILLFEPANATESMTGMLDCDTDSECTLVTGYPAHTGMLPNPPKYPRLVGHGCEGATGPIYAFEEDHFPECEIIREMDWNWLERMA